MTWDVIGQDRAVAVLRRAVEDPSRLSHAYLFAGPERVGRATAARRFAQALNCRAEGERPCGECRSCRVIAEDKHPDIEWVVPGGLCDEPEHKDHEGSRDIRICQVRHVERVTSRTAVEANTRVIIVDPAELLTLEAANAFLKTLEEPAPNTVIVLITAREEALSETVRSRCRRIGFAGVPREAIESALVERWQAAPDVAARLARGAGGRLGWAVAALEDERLLAERDEAIAEVEAVLAGGYGERFRYAGELGRAYAKERASVVASLEAWRDWWRDVLLVAAEREDLVVESERLDTLRSHAAQYGVAGAVQALTALNDGGRHLEERASPTLAMESMLLALPVRTVDGREDTRGSSFSGRT